MDRCTGCGAPRLPMAYCPQCQTPYEAAPPPPHRARAWDADGDEARGEYRVRLYAPPVALLLAFLVYGSEGGRAFFRVFVSMWLHELGHATAGWLCGYAAVPGPWRTAIPDERSWFFLLLVVAGLAYGIHRTWRAERRVLAGALAGLLLLHLALVLGLRPAHARAFFTFFGDGGGMVLGAALMATFYVPVGHHLQRTWLRWGFLVIGALGFMDPFREWLRARRDAGAIPYGEIEGVGLSDPTKLVDVHGWSQGAMVSRYVLLGVVCLLAIVATYAYGVWQARRALLERDTSA